MPIGGSNIGWDPNSPPDTESAGLGDDRIRSLKTSIQEALNNEHNFGSGGGANTGYHLFGSARPYYGLQSAVSSSGSDARMMLTSDTSRLFAVGSVATSFIGGPTVISAGSYPGGAPPQRAYWAMEFGVGKMVGSTITTLTFPNSGYSGAPFVLITPVNDVTSIITLPMVTTITATTFAVRAQDASPAASVVTFHWMSVGSRTL